jgi:hypothetical protein
LLVTRSQQTLSILSSSRFSFRQRQLPTII